MTCGFIASASCGHWNRCSLAWVLCFDARRYQFNTCNFFVAFKMGHQILEIGADTIAATNGIDYKQQTQFISIHHLPLYALSVTKL